jgi:uncharacterized membrane protein YbaN (DUF454 family)
MYLSTKRTILIISGFLSLAIGVVGIFVPLLPTTPFVLLAAFCFSKSSERLHHWLVHHPRLGPIISDWEQNGVIRLRIKIIATLTMVLLVSYPLLFMAFPILLKIIVVLSIVGVLIFIWTRPSRVPIITEPS